MRPLLCLCVSLIVGAPLAGAPSEAGVTEVRLPVPVYRELLTHIHWPQGLKPGEKRPCVLFVYSGKVGAFGCKLPAELTATQGLVTTHFSAADNLPAEFNAAGPKGLGHAGQDAIYTLLKHVLSLPEVDKENVGIVTHSAGIVAATGALARHPDIQVKFLIDWEGPPGFPGPRGSSPDKKYVEERAAAEFIKRIRCCYLRVQGEIDHHPQRWANNEHAIEMLNNATRGLCPWTRCNNNPPNILYNDEHPEKEKRKWFPGRLGPHETDKLKLSYVAEMVKMLPPKAKSEKTKPASDRAAEARTQLPVYVYLFAHYEDHINLELSEWRIKEVIRILSDARRTHPNLVAAVGEFYGADSEIFQQRNAESGIVDLIRRCVTEGWYDVGYHGTHEPTYATSSQWMRSLTGKSWQEIYEATCTFYTAYRDLRTGEPDTSRKGGAARMQEVFGRCSVLSGAAGAANPPGMLALADLTGCRVHFGFTDHGPAMFNRDYIPAVLEIRQAISPTPETSPDVFWFMGCLITSSHPDRGEIGLITPEERSGAVVPKFERLDRTRVAVPQMIYGVKFIYARAEPTGYAYGGPERTPPQVRAIRESRGDDFRLPPELIFPESERKQKVENFRQNLDWLLTRYFPANPGSRLVGNRLLLDLTVPYAGESIGLVELDGAAEALLKNWTDRPPNFVSTGKGHLTLAQTFKLLATALKSHAEHGSLPTTLQTDMTFGPIGVWPEVVQGTEQEVDAKAVINAAATMTFGPERKPGSPEPPSNRVPLNVSVDGKKMHAAQFLRLMAETYEALRAGKPPGVLRVRPSNILPPLARPWQRAHRLYEDTPAAYGFLQLWTVKPAQFKEAIGERRKIQSRRETTRDARALIQFRMNVNYFPDEAAARENCRMLRRHLGLFRRAGVKASYWFTGLAAQQVQRIDPEFIRLLNEAGMPIAHHGANRPPNPQPIHRVKGENWEDDVRAILDYESNAIDPRTGTLDKTKAGGLKRMQEMFGNRIAVTGRFFEASILYATKQFGCRAMIGLGGNTGGSSNAGWFLGMMGMPDAQSIAPDMLRAEASGKLDLFRFIEDSATRQPSQEVRSIAVLIHDHDFLQGSPALPQQGFLRGSADLQRQLWDTYAKLVQWAAKHPRLRVVTFEEILGQIADDRTKTVSRAAVVKAAEAVAASREAPPEFIQVGGDYLSLTDTFQAFAVSLAEFARSGKLPEQVTVRDILGPTRYRLAERPARGSLEYAQDAMQLRREGRLTTDPARIATTPKPQSVDLEVSGEKIIAVAGSLDLTKEIPASIEVNDGEVNPTVFLQLMAQTVRNLDNSKGPGTAHVSGRVSVLPLQVQENMLADALTKLQFWTYKPERWKENKD